MDVVYYSHGKAPLAYLKMDTVLPTPQLIDGWYPIEEGFSWTKPDAKAVLMRPEGALSFEVAACLPAQQIAALQRISLEVMLESKLMGRYEFTTRGCQTVSSPVPPGASGVVEVELHISPPFAAPKPDSRVFGLSITAFGFR